MKLLVNFFVLHCIIYLNLRRRMNFSCSFFVFIPKENYIIRRIKLKCTELRRQNNHLYSHHESLIPAFILLFLIQANLFQACSIICEEEVSVIVKTIKQVLKKKIMTVKMLYKVHCIVCFHSS